MTVYTFVCKAASGSWSATCKQEEDMTAEAGSVAELKQALAALVKDKSGAGYAAWCNVVVKDKAMVCQYSYGGAAVSSGGGAAPAAGDGGAAAPAAAAPEPEEEEEEEEMAFDLFD